MSDWDAVRQLAADFQKLQSSTGAFYLSEGNCVEVVTKLVDMGLLEVLYTLDGKEYITPQHLEREIKNELISNRGLFRFSCCMTMSILQNSPVNIDVNMYRNCLLYLAICWSSSTSMVCDSDM